MTGRTYVIRLQVAQQERDVNMPAQMDVKPIVLTVTVFQAI
jgi:hypothetical protein